MNSFPLKFIAIFCVCNFSKNNLSPYTDSCKKTLCQNLSLKNRTYHLCFFYNTEMYLADKVQVFLERHKKYGFIFQIDLNILSIVKTKDNSKFFWPSQKIGTLQKGWNVPSIRSNRPKKGPLLSFIGMQHVTLVFLISAR